MFVATSDSAGPTVLTDVMAGYENDKHFRGSELWFDIDSGTANNRGLQVRCLDSDRDTATLTLASGLVDAPATGDIACAFNVGGEGDRIRTYDATINDVIRGLGSSACPVYSEELADVWDTDIYWVDIPTTFTHISEVQYIDSNGNYISIPMYGIRLDIENKLMAIDPEFGAYADGLTIRINGRKAHSTLSADTDTTEVDFEWITYSVAARMLITKRDQLKVNRGGMYANAANALIGKAGPFQVHGELVKVR